MEDELGHDCEKGLVKGVRDHDRLKLEKSETSEQV